MKKSLIALAVLATAGTSFAQSTVTLSGKLRFAYENTTVTTAGVAADTNGLRVTDGNFTLTAVEDLGAGMKMVASMDVQSRGRTTAIAGRDASLTLSGGFGAVLIGAIEAGNGIIGLGGAGAPVYGLDNGVVLAGAGNVDILRYYTPNMSGFKGYVSVLDTTVGAGGMQSTAAAQDATQIGVTYAGGPVAAAADITNYGLNAVVVGADNRLRMSGSYNLGMVNLGLGYEKRKTTAALNNGSHDWLVGVAVPMGQTTVGLNYARRSVDGVAQDANGVDFGVKYDLSKRTYVAVHYQKETAGAAAGVVQNDTKKYRIQLAHAF
ncbi:MAG: porin [Rhodoferax sp.]|uniref:porin n=1 Tax=Rhodoferax sp. TaxID=50421 RepID=UPI002736CF3C|nr:porin [Rhodoferax sp.]MDP2678680.1 porin [Rhodoferax sp.]